TKHRLGVTYTSISSNADPLAWAIDFFGLQESESPKAAPLSPDYEVPVKDQPYATANSPIALSRGYIADPDPKEDLKDKSEDGPTDYSTDEEDDDDDDSLGDDTDDEDEEEASEEDEDEEEEEYLAPADSTAAASLIVDPVPSTEETKPFETDESVATPPPPPAYRTTTISVRGRG
ncbi:hypothetical protein Tco_0220521, partial [Tanacetum coccineum]